MHERSRPSRRSWDEGKGGGEPPRTPLGHSVESRYGELSRRIQEDLRNHGREASLPSSAFRLQSLYLDFGRTALAEHISEPILRALGVPPEATGLAARDPRLLEAERQSFGEIEDEDVNEVAGRVARMSRRALTAALVFNAHFWNVRLALAVVGGRLALERAALGVCSFVAERRIGGGLGGDLRYYAPLRERREAFCTDHCLPVIGPRPSDDRQCDPSRTSADCGMLGILEGFRFFASFPDE
ncbi:MAG TPA: hypothetical protein VL691_10520 [Vicinamibacteria bacterium]|nr:hypothetical protein [Vicinamibacteria bacterium]